MAKDNKTPTPEETKAAEDAAKAAADKAAEDAAKAAAEGEGMAAKVEDGVNPHAPARSLSLAEQLEVAQAALDTHRKQMAAAKRKHESNLEEVGRLRKLLARGEASVVDNEYERLTQQEHALMSRVQNLQNQTTSRTVTGAGSR